MWGEVQGGEFRKQSSLLACHNFHKVETFHGLPRLSLHLVSLNTSKEEVQVWLRWMNGTLRKHPSTERGLKHRAGPGHLPGLHQSKLRVSVKALGPLGAPQEVPGEGSKCGSLLSTPKSLQLSGGRSGLWDIRTGQETPLGTGLCVGVSLFISKDKVARE